jgi:hypothetical protein
MNSLNYTTLSESQRVLEQQSPSSFINNVLTPVLPGGYNVPLMVVETIPASLTLIQRQTLSIYNANDPYNPATRFSQYFPPAPVPYVCPPTQPNNSPQAPIVPCIAGTGRFTGSVAGQAPTG